MSFLARLGGDRFLPVVTLDDAADVGPPVDALAAGGLRTVEITLRTDAGLPALARVAARDEVWVGAGTVTSTGEVGHVVAAGARFVVTPGFDVRIVERCLHHGVPVLAAGVPVSFDVNHRDGVWRERDPRPVYRELAERATVVFAGEDEARMLTGSSTADPTALLDELADLLPGDVVLKRGAHGCLGALGGQRYDVPAVPVSVLDSVGAGDAFVAGYLATLVQGMAPDQRLGTAVRCGALACLAVGDWEGLPTLRDLEALEDPEPIRR